MHLKKWTGLFLLAACGSLAPAQQFTISTIAGGAPPAAGVAANASIGQPARVAWASGNLYFTSGNSVFKVGSNGNMALVAGNSRPGFSGDGGPAVNGQLNAPKGITVDSGGNLYIADSGNNRVRMVSPNGIITTAAGNGTRGYSGDNGPALNAQLHLPSGVAVDSAGYIYIADTANYCIRQVSLDGTIRTWVGTGFSGYSGDAGAASEGAMSNVEDVAIDSSGNLYIADTSNNTVRKVTPKLTITTYAGNGTITADGGAATTALLNEPFSVAVDTNGNLYIAEFGGNRIRQVNAKGIITTVAGTGAAGYAGDGSPASKAQLYGPTGVAADSSGNVYVADQGNDRVRTFSSSGNISTIAGNGSISFSGDGGAASKAQLSSPTGMAVDTAGNIYLSDTGNNRVRKISSGVVSTVAGNGTAGFGGDGGPAANAQLSQPNGLAVDASGNLYIADTANHRVRQVAPNGNIATVAGNGSPGFAGDSGQATSAQLNSPAGVAVDAAGNLYIAELSNSRVRKVSKGIITTVAGNGGTSYAGDGGPAPAALVNSPLGVAVDASGNLYIADTSNNRVRMVSASGIITTVAGNGFIGYLGDGGLATNAQLIGPVAVAVDAAGNLYIADASARIRKVAPNGTINTIAGSGAPGYTGDGGLATSAQMAGSTGLAVDASSNVYFSDTLNNAIRALQPTGFGIAVKAVTNGASNLVGSVSPGEVVALYGSGLGPATLAALQIANGRVQTSAGGARVLFNGIPAPILYASATQVGAIVPYGISGQNVSVVAQYLDQTSAPVTVAVASSAPGVFTLDSSGRGQAAAINANGSVNSAGSPARAGSVISLYATGEGQTTPAGTDGLPAPNPAPKPVLPVTVTIGGQSAQVQYAGGAPGTVEGVMQVNVTIPSGIAAGNAVPVVVGVGTVSSQTGVTIAVN